MIYTITEWLETGKKMFGEDKKKWKFVCPHCGNVQSFEDFKKLSNCPEHPENYMAFSCIGIFMENPGTIFNKKSPCNYTNGGLFDLSKAQVKTDDGKLHSVFDFYKEVKSENL